MSNEPKGPMADADAATLKGAANALSAPWRYVPWHIAEGNSQVRSAAGWVVCETPGDDFSRLIAAAPELLDALETALVALQSECVCGSECLSCARAKAVIASALGAA